MTSRGAIRFSKPFPTLLRRPPSKFMVTTMAALAVFLPLTRSLSLSLARSFASYRALSLSASLCLALSLSLFLSHTHSLHVSLPVSPFLSRDRSLLLYLSLSRCISLFFSVSVRCRGLSMAPTTAFSSWSDPPYLISQNVFIRWF